MARESYALQQAKIEKEINKLKKKAEALRNRRRKPVIASIVRTMREYDITPEELAVAYGKGPGRRTAARKAAAPSAAKKTVAPKYRHPETGETWSGRGKPPRWLVNAEAAGADRASFLIDKS
jgi:DNA-binding protein H-NS